MPPLTPQQAILLYALLRRRQPPPPFFTPAGRLFWGQREKQTRINPRSRDIPNVKGRNSPHPIPPGDDLSERIKKKVNRRPI